MKAATRRSYQEKVDVIVRRIVAALGDAIDLEALAREACLSPFHFHRVFKGMVGETPLELARRVRLERAAWQLATTTTGVTAIAFEAGFDTHEAFTRAFHAAYGTSPSGFRAAGTRRIALAAACGVHFSATGEAPVVIPRDSGGRTMDVQISNERAFRIAAMRHIGPYQRIGETFARLGQAAAEAGLASLAGAQMIALYHDDPESTPPDALRSDAGIVVPDDVALPPTLMDVRIPASRYAKAVHRGPYDRLGDTWQRLMGEWLPSSGHHVAESPSFERYVNDPRTAKAEDLVTEILVPLADG